MLVKGATALMILTIQDKHVPVFHENICRMNSPLELKPFLHRHAINTHQNNLS